MDVIVAGIVDHLDPVCFWRERPLDWTSPDPASYKGLCLGAAGVLWALRYVDAPDVDRVVPSHFLGEVGVLLVHWRLDGDHGTAGNGYAFLKVYRRISAMTVLYESAVIIER